MKAFFDTLKDCLTSKDFVGQFKDRRVSSAAWFMFRVSLMVGLVTTVGVVIIAYSSVRNFSATAVIDKYYPSGLEVTLENGMVRTNVTEPYAIPMDGGPARSLNAEDVNTSTSSQGDYTHLLVIDTTTDNPLGQIEKVDTYVLLTKDRLLVRDDNEIRVFSLQDATFTINKETVVSLAEKLRPFVYTVLVVGLVLLPFVVALGTLIGTLIVALFYALIVLIVARVRHIELQYGQAYILSMYLVAWPTLAGLLVAILGFNISFIELGLFVILTILLIKVPPAPAATTVSETEPVSTPTLP